MRTLASNDNADLSEKAMGHVVDRFGQTPEVVAALAYRQVLPLDITERLVALASDAVLVVYGPFNDGGRFSSDSNRDFDAWLKARDPRSGLRDKEAVDALATAVGFTLQADLAMPANNRCLAWARGARKGAGP